MSLFAAKTASENTFVAYPDAVDLEQFFVIVADGEPINKAKTGSRTKPEQREFRTHDDAVRFAAALVSTGHVSTFQVESVYRAV